MSQPTPQAVSLYNALRERKIYCELEAWDEHKHIDISIPWAQIDIEIDGLQHYTNPEEIKKDFRRTYYSVHRKDYDTIHIPNYIIESHLNQVADALAAVARSHHDALKEEKADSDFRGVIRRFINGLFE
ncbi:MAG: hypothetical protein NTW66_00470 [Candidatus Magasanikbacteria bacterium]|nr:hypothetical protein [Candidatus Magasanikbacteria bacterium]